MDDSTPAIGQSASPVGRVGVSGAANVAGFAATTLIALLLTPFLIRQLGAEGYGVWALIMVAIMALQLADLGLPRALSRMTAEAWHAGDGLWARQALSTTLALFALVGLTLVGGMLLLAETAVARWLAIPAAWQREARVALALVTLAVVPSLLAVALTAALEGLQRMDLSNLALVCGRATFAGAAVAAVAGGYGIRGVAAATLLGAGAQAAAAWLGLRWAWRGVRLAMPQRATALLLLSFALPVFMSHAIGLAYTPLSKLALARAAPLDVVGHYEAISGLASQLFMLAWALAMATFPPLAAAWSARQPDAAQRLYRRAMRWGCVLVMPPGVFMLALAEPVLALWMGESVPGLGWMLRLVMVGWLVDALIAPAGMALQAIGKPGRVLLAVGVNGGMNAALSLALAPCCGLAGVAVANLLSAVVSSALMLALCHRALGLPVTVVGLWRWAAWLALPVALLALWGVGLRGWAGAWLPVIAAASLSYLLACGACLWLWGPLAADERAWVRQRAPASVRRWLRWAAG